MRRRSNFALPYHRHALGNVQRRLFAAVHPRRVLRAAAGGVCRGRRRNPRAGCACRSSFWCSPAWSSECFPALTIGPIPRYRGAFGARDPQMPQYSLSVWHGLTVPLMMSMLALAGRRISLSGAATLSGTWNGWRALPRRVQGPRFFDSILAAVSWRWARALSACSARGACSRNSSARRHGLPPYGHFGRGLHSRALPATPLDPPFHADMDRRQAMRGRCGLAGQISPAGALVLMAAWDWSSA